MYKGITDKHLAVKELCRTACLGIKIMYNAELQRVPSHKIHISIESPVELNIFSSGQTTKFEFKGEDISLDSTLKDRIPDFHVHLFVEMGLLMPVLLDTYFKNVLAATRSDVEKHKAVIEGDLVEDAL